MKKIILLIPLCVAMVAFSACGSENADNANSTTANSVMESAAVISEDNADISETDEVITQNETEAADVEIKTEKTTQSEIESLSEETTASELTAAATAAAVTTSAQSEQAETPEEPASLKSIVVYFSCTGNTKSVAEIIAEKQGADIYEIVPEQPYTDEDLDYGNRSSRSTSEQNDSSSRPAISGSIDLDGYDTVYVGYPIWWADMPRIMYTFFDTYDLSGKNIAPFCTSGGSGLSGTPRTIAELEPSASVTAGLHVSGYDTDSADSDIEDWLAEIGLSE